MQNGSEKIWDLTSMILSLIDSVQFWYTSLATLDKSLGKKDFKYSRQEFDTKLLDLVK